MVPPPRDGRRKPARSATGTSGPTLVVAPKPIGQTMPAGRDRASTRRKAQNGWWPRVTFRPKPVGSSGPTEVAPPSLDHHRGGGRSAASHELDALLTSHREVVLGPAGAHQSLRATRLPGPPPSSS